MTSPTLAAPNAEAPGLADAAVANAVPGTTTRRISIGVNTLVVIVVGMLITAGLSLGARAVHGANEDRLLRQRVRGAAAVVTSALPRSQTPLTAASLLAEATNGDAAAFRQLMQPIVDEGTPFISASLWPANAASPRPLVVVGRPPELATQPEADVQDFFSRVTGESTLAIYDMLGESDRRLGYAAAIQQNPKFIVSAEAALPRDRRARVDRDSAFADLDYALFLGSTPDLDRMLASSTGGARLRGRTDSITVPFGDSELLLVMHPQRALGGTLMANLWWILAVMGLALTIAAAALVERLSRRQRQAEALAQENEQLYATQRSVALTLQHSLLAESLPDIPGLELSARYVAGGEGIDIGGDWYDVIALNDGRVLVTVGDVSGRGLQAATSMASLRYAIRAYAAQGDGPGTILTKLSELMNLRRDGHFATALCALIDLDARSVTFASAGHPQPLLVDGAGSAFVSTKVGIPVGVRDDASYAELSTDLPSGGTLLFYTDGLIERRGEVLSEGFDRLARAAAKHANGSLEANLSAILDEVIPQASADDTALLGVRWTM